MSLTLEQAYSRVLEDSLFAFVWRNGKIEPIYLTESPFKTGFIHLIPGSFNPLHAAHKAIYDGIDAEEKMFEIAIERTDKEFLVIDSLKARLDQFDGVAPILVNRWPYFIQKAGVLRHWTITFHIGIDTAVRLLQSTGVAGIQGISARFTIYDRFIDGERLGIHNHRDFDGRSPLNCFRGDNRHHEMYMGLSSTQIRNSLGVRDVREIDAKDLKAAEDGTFFGDS